MKIITVLFFLVAMTAAVWDWREHRIPDGCCVAILFLALFKWISIREIPLWEYLFGGAAVSMPMFLLALFVKGSFGGGDIKFVAVCGLFLGWKQIWTGTIYAIFVAAIYAIILLCKGCDKHTYFPLGPFLFLGILIGVHPALF